MTRVLRGLGALMILALILVGAPVLLLRIGRLDAVSRIPWTHLLSQPDNGDLLLVILTVVAWLAWGHLTLTVASELVSAFTGHRVVIPVPGSQWLRPIAGALVAALAGLVIVHTLQATRSAGPSAPATSSSPLPGTGTTEPSTPRPAGPTAPVRVTGTPAPLAAPLPASGHEPGSHDPAPAVRAHPGDTAAPDQRPAIYIVQPGDDLWTLAVTLYGDGLRWHSLASTNHLDAEQTLQPGTVLTVPGLNQSEVSRLTGQAHIDRSDRTVVVHPGDTLAALAKSHLGSAAYWPAIQQSNPTLILDPDHLEPGWLLHLPPRLGTSSAHHTHPPASSDEAPSATAPGSTEAGDPQVAISVLGETGTALRDGPPRLEPALPDGASTSPPVEANLEEPRPTSSAEPPGVVQEAGDAADNHSARGIVGGLAAAVLAGVGLELARRRRGQLWGRPLGRRVWSASPPTQHFHQALAQLAATADDGDPGVGPTTVVVGERVDAGQRTESVTVTLREVGSLRLVGPVDLVVAAAGGVATSLSCAPWSENTPITAVGAALSWLTGLDNPALELIADVDEGLSRLQRTLVVHTSDSRAGAEPLVFLIDLTECDPVDQHAVLARFEPLLVRPADVAVVWLCGEDSALALPAGARRVLSLLSEERARLDGEDSEFLPNLVSEPARRALVELFDVTTRIDTQPAPWWAPEPDETPRATPAVWNEEPMNRGSAPPLGVLTLLPSPPVPTGAEPTSPGLLPLTRRPATHDVEDTVPPVPEFLATADHPVLLLLGEVELIGARGPRPVRAVKQCEEYCAWILEHPGRTAVAMTRSLLVAEGTRRSNMSRLRTWLGTDEFGDDYLPDAYSGHITMHPGITTDWEQLRLLISAGVNRATNDALVEALDLVRGAPLADAAPGQWHWAEELRIEMSSTIRDIGAVLAGRALAANDIDLARWAAARALTAAPEDELLMAVRVRTEHLAGNRSEVERLVLHITRQARLLGVDLADETVTVLQEAMEGRARARRA